MGGNSWVGVPRRGIWVRDYHLTRDLVANWVVEDGTGTGTDYVKPFPQLALVTIARCGGMRCGGVGGFYDDFNSYAPRRFNDS